MKRLCLALLFFPSLALAQTIGGAGNYGVMEVCSPAGCIFSGPVSLGDDVQLQFGDGLDYWCFYDSAATTYKCVSTDVDGGGTDGVLWSILDGTDDVDFTGEVTAASLTVNGGAVFNESSVDVDFRVESDSNENMLFVDGGNNTVGIGISTPSQQLTISEAGDGSTYPILKLNFTSDSSHDGEDIFGEIQFGNDDGENSVGAQPITSYIRSVYTRPGTGYGYEDGGLTFGVLGNNVPLKEAMRIDYVGRVGIGTTSASEILDIVGNIELNGVLYLPATTTESRAIEVGTGRTGNGLAYIDFIGDATYSNYGLRVIRRNGGVNTTSEIEHRGTGQLLLNAADAGEVAIYTSDTERVTVDSAGNVGIGISAPSAKLDIVGDTEINNTTGGTISLVDTTTAGDADGTGNIYFVAEDDATNSHTMARIEMDVTAATSGSEEADLVFYYTTPASGASTEALRLDGSASGATFSGTATSDAFISSTANPASTGALRVANTEGLYARNAANDGDESIVLDGSDIWQSSTDVAVPATNKIYLDGGGDTYIYEDSADTISFMAGGATAARISSTDLTLLGLHTSSELYFYRADTTFNNGDIINRIIYTGRSEPSNASENYATVLVAAEEVSDDDEDGSYTLTIVDDGADVDYFKCDASDDKEGCYFGKPAVLNTQVSATPTAPTTCDATALGMTQVVNDSDDGAGTQICYCGMTDDSTYDWLDMSDNTACDHY